MKISDIKSRLNEFEETFDLTAGGRNSFEISGNTWLTKENTWIVKDFQGQVINI